jgi:hypothetical protein
VGGVYEPSEWTATPPLNRRSCLTRKRAEFWETQPSYGGSPEVWAALRSAIESPDMRLAILESAEIRLPSQTWTEIYDSRGCKYDLPNYVLSDPINLLDDMAHKPTDTDHPPQPD